jgi:predicted PurR-regulated permease PerM
VDNLFRFWLQKRMGDTHPLITIFGVILGINLFGFIGLIFGPILISLFLLMIQIYHREFSAPAERP